MRILAVQTGLSPKSVLGGTITDRGFLTRLADRGVEVHVLAEAGEPIVEHSNFTHHYWRPKVVKALAPLVRRIPYAGNADVWRDLRACLREIEPVDWVRFNSPYYVGPGALWASNGTRIWGSYLHCEDKPLWKWVDSWLPSRCDLITCLSDDTREDVIARCPAAHDRVLVTPVGIPLGPSGDDPAERQQVRARLGIAEGEVLVLFIGVLSPRKGIADLVAAWKMLPRTAPIRLLVIGSQIAEIESQQIAALTRDDPRTMHIPRVPYESISMYFRAADIFCFPTHLEGFGIVVGEAMAAGLPVVTTRAKGVRSMVLEDRTALLADVGCPNQLATYLERLRKDPELRKRLGAAGRQRIQECFQWDGIIDRLLGVLRNGITRAGVDSRPGFLRTQTDYCGT
jgi:glycosyltransferase involved in cell wall biosynthesis